MYIRRKVFSLLNVEGEEKYFSTTDFSLEDNGEVRLFSEEDKVDLKNVKGHSGRGRTAAHILMDPTSGIGALAGRKAGKKAADKADAEGATDRDIVKKAGRKGAAVGAATGAAGAGLLTAGALALAKKSGVKINKKQMAQMIGGVAGTAALGAIGGRNSARVQTKDRLIERSSREQDNRKKKNS